MIKILRSSSVPATLLGQLREWFESEWAGVDPFEGNHPTISIPAPIVAVNDENSLVGGLAFTSASNPQSTDVCIWVNMVLVSPDHRKKGIASMLIQSAESEAADSGANELFVLSEFPDLYQKLGWRIVALDSPEREVILTKTLTIECESND